MKVVTGAEMRSIEQRVQAAGTPISELASRAGRALADCVIEEWPSRPCLVLAGPGNNGGDGEIAAAHLCEAGIDVTVYAFRRKGARETRYARVESDSDTDLSVLASLLGTSPIVVDSLLGTGAFRPLEGRLAEIVEAVNATGLPVLSTDIATGVSPDTGAVPGVAVRATQTLAFGFAKVGNVVFPGAGYTGKLRVATLGISPSFADSVRLAVTSEGDIRKILPTRSANSSKGTYGRVLVVGGSHAYPSAPGLASIAALRAGAGLAQAAVPSLSQLVIAAHALEPIYSVLPEEDGQVSEQASPIIDRDLDRADALVFGPGLGNDEAVLTLTSHLLESLRTRASTPAVIDADGLNALARLGTWWGEPIPLVLTPHPGEMSRLTGLTIDEVQSDRVGVARKFAATWGAVVVLKGAGTAIARPDGLARINPTGGPNLATGGTGDVLSGVIGGLLAQRLAPWDAAVAGVYLHGLAGDRLAWTEGDAGTLAGDLLLEIPRARHALLYGGQFN